MSTSPVDLSTAPDGPETPVRRGALGRLVRNPLGLVAGLVLLLVVMAVVCAPLLTSQLPTTANLENSFGPPQSGHPLGFDTAGRDILARLLYGGRNTLGGACLALLVALAIGVPSGLAAGYFGSWWDGALTWVFNLLMALPAMIVLLAARAVLGPTVWVLMVILGILASPAFFRLVRGVTADVRHEPYIDTARVSGLSHPRIITSHVLRVVRAPIIIQTSLVAGVALGLQAGLEFIGVGSSSDTPTWGSMLNEGFQVVTRSPSIMLWPALTLGMTTAALVLLAVALRDAFEDDPAPPVRRTPAAPRERASGGHVLERSGLLSIRDLVVSYPRPDGSAHDVVRGVDLDVPAGRVIGLVGESGSGKTQVALSALGLLPATASQPAGSIEIHGRELLGAGERQWRDVRGRVVGYVPQEPLSNLDPSFTVGYQLVEPLRVVLGLGRREARRRALDLLAQVEIADPERVFASYPHEISGGMAQRVLIAGAIACDPSVLVADEPTTALDVTVQAEVLGLVRRLRDERNLGVLLVTHDFGVVADLCDEVLVMRDGGIVERGPVDQILRAPAHPYTRALLAAMPEPVGDRSPVPAIPEVSP